MYKQRKKINNQLKKSMSKPIYEYKIESSAPSSWIESLSGTNTWSNRQIEQIKSKNRFLFAVEEEDICDEWVAVINFLIDSSHTSF